jgi:hypothetical protein
MASQGSTTGDHMLMGRVLAAVELLGHSGVKDVEFAYDEDEHYPEKVLWWAKGNWGGTRKYSAHFPYPAQALEDLLSRVLNGGMCGRCRKTSVVGVVLDGDYCCFLLTAKDVDDSHGYEYVRTCQTAEFAGRREGEK